VLRSKTEECCAAARMSLASSHSLWVFVHLPVDLVTFGLGLAVYATPILLLSESPGQHTSGT
jgi:hypothetical protein